MENRNEINWRLKKALILITLIVKIYKLKAMDILNIMIKDQIIMS